MKIDSSPPPAIILGTSNSILRDGWVDGLRECNAFEVKNLSAGASASAFILWQMLDSGLPLSAPETSRFLLDTIVNDETFVQANRYELNWWHYYQRHLLAALPASRTTLIGFSSQKFFQDGSALAALQEQVYLAAGASVVSLRRILLAALQECRMQRPERGVDDIFEDPGHFRRHLAKLFGRWIGRKLGTASGTAALPPQRSLAEAGFETLLPDAPHQGVPEQRATALRTQDTLRFPIGASFRLSGRRILHGICVDASRTRCFIDIDVFGKRRPSLSLELAYNADSPRMQIKFVHFPQPLTVGRDGCTVTVREQPGFPLTRGIHSRRAQGPMARLQLLSFLSGPVVPPPADPFAAGPLQDMPDQLTATEAECLRQSNLVETLVTPPDLPSYPRSFIEL